jgi:formiminotetrahydrofolate cyclodeaminase
MKWLAALCSILATALGQIVAAMTQQKKNDAAKRQIQKDKDAEDSLKNTDPTNPPAA